MPIVLLLAACEREGKPPAQGGPPSSDPDSSVSVASPSGLDPVGRLARASLDVRGVRPSLDEIERIEADPTALDAMVEGYLADPRFSERVMASYQEVFLSKLEELSFYDYAAVPVL